MESEKKLCRAFNLTISTREDLTEPEIDYVVNWCRKTKYCSIVTERRPTDGVLHLHAALFFEQNQDPRSIRDTLWKRIKLGHPTSIGRVACQVQAMPGDKWVSSYLTKDPNSLARGSTLPLLPDGSVDVKALEPFFPSKAVQDLLQQKAASKKDANGKEANAYMKRLELQYSRWLEDQPLEDICQNEPENHSFLNRESTSTKAHTFLMYLNNVARTDTIPRDRRKVFELALNLHEFMTESCKLTAEAKRKHATENGQYDFSGRN